MPAISNAVRNRNILSYNKLSIKLFYNENKYELCPFVVVFGLTIN